tara:strand:+ start:46 stop:2838 length:2793 start_codon:yes stop_codon:yes gene_type:complete
MYKIIITILFFVFLKADDLHPQPPEIPTLQAWADHETVYLYWDKKAENSIDPYSGYADFEGYRLYRSDDGGKTWGGIWDKIFDYSENHVGWKPIVQYDYTITQDTSRCTYSNDFKYNDGAPCDLCVGSTCSDDQTGAYSTVGGCETVVNVFQQSCNVNFLGQIVKNECPVSCDVAQNLVRFVRDVEISEYDPEALWVDLGNNSGIYRLYTDQDVNDGIEYMYALTAYDMGLKTYEVEFSDDNEDGIFSGDTTWSSSNPDHILSPNGGALHSLESPRLYESFTDYNKNGTWDVGEPFADSNNNAIWDKRENPINVAIITPSYLASNIEGFIEDGVSNTEVMQNFIKPDSLNIGNGYAHVNVVNEAEVEAALFHFEINACLDRESYGDSLGSYASGCKSFTQDADNDCASGCLETGPPSLYAYEISSADSLPLFTEIIDLSIINDATDEGLDSILFYKGLPGADTTIAGQVTLPIYAIENFKLEYMNHEKTDWVNNWTEWFNGFHYRFDNNFDIIPPTAWVSYFTRLIPYDLVDNDGNGFYSDGDESDLLDRIDFKIAYNNLPSIFNRHPNYSYKITFSSDVVDTASAVAPLAACRDQLDVNGAVLNTLLPFTVENITLGQQANINHKDKGIEQAYIEFGEVSAGICTECVTGEPYPYICMLGMCVYKTGWKNCSWDHNESFFVEETVYKSNNLDGESKKIFEYKLDFNHLEYYEFIKNDPTLDKAMWETALTNAWTDGDNYDSAQVVFYGATAWSRRGMFYQAKKDIINSTNPPDIWYDSDGDNVNDNPWKTIYPWKTGEWLEVHPYKWFVDGDSWIMDLSAWGKVDASFKSSDLEAISVVPNPYIVDSRYEDSGGGHKLYFTRLPNECTISIYTVTGEFVRKLDYSNPFRGDLFWNLKNSNEQVVAPGLYIYVVEASSGETYTGKFAVVR